MLNNKFVYLELAGGCLLRYCMLTDSDVLSSAALGVAPPGAWRGCACASVSRFGCEVRLRDPCAVLCNYPVCVPAPPGPLPRYPTGVHRVHIVVCIAVI